MMKNIYGIKNAVPTGLQTGPRSYPGLRCAPTWAMILRPFGPFVNGGGENRTLVLSKLPINVYMLIALLYNGPDERRHTRDQGTPSCLGLFTLRCEKGEGPYQG